MKNYMQAYKGFINSRNVSEGLRITAGIAVPAFIMSYFGLLTAGIVMSVGALCVAATDNPGPVHHRFNGMFVCNLLIFFTTIIVAWAFHSTLILGVVLFIFCFIFSMLGVYGTRESSIGIAALLVMVLNLQHPKHGWEIVMNALFILAGGVWFMIFSLLLHRLSPYKIIQQSLGHYIESTAGYLRERVIFYNKDVQFDDAYNQLLLKQANVQEMQNIVSELLFKTRTIVEESTPKGRILLMIYLDAADIFERVMTSYQQYGQLHQYFKTTTILEQCKTALLQLADELDVIGIAVKSGTPSIENNEIPMEIKKIRDYFNELRLNVMKPDNLEGFVSMGRIVESLQDLSERINILHHYTSYNIKLKKKSNDKISYDKYIEHKAIKPRLLFDNLNFNSNVFRHSLRVSVAVIIGYVISLLFHTGHSYWILLTIIVILKPAYSLTKKRNKDRIIGTLCGVIMGILIIYFIKNNIALLVLLLIFMTGCYIFLRTNYFISVLFMTPYLLIFFHLLYPADFRALLTDRLSDTAIGSVIAFITSIFFIPAWEHTTIKTYMVKMLEDNSNYYKVTAAGFFKEQPASKDEIRLAGKNAFVSLANLSDAFTRMLSEPKRHQKEAESVHRFVVLNHILASHIATLSYYLQTKKSYFRSPDFEPVAKNTFQYFTTAIAFLKSGDEISVPPEKLSLRLLNDHAEILMEKRKQEVKEGSLETETKNQLVRTKPVTDQFNYIYSIATDISKVSGEIKLA
ncbi:MAG: FUSC family membrane protein [Ginsengibacter sp.]